MSGSTAHQASSIADLRGIVREAVLLFRAHGIKRAQALAAGLLNMTVRRVRSWWEGDVTSVSSLEAAAIRASRILLLEQQIAHHEAEAARLTQAREAARATISANRLYAARSDLAAAHRLDAHLEPRGRALPRTEVAARTP